jgi:hypothetical protein
VTYTPVVASIHDVHVTTHPPTTDGWPLSLSLSCLWAGWWDEGWGGGTCGHGLCLSVSLRAVSPECFRVCERVE